MSLKELIENFTKKDIQSFLKKLKNTEYRSSWKKAKLVEQVLAYDTERVLKIFTSNQLKEGLKRFGLSTTGKKSELLERLSNMLNHEPSIETTKILDLLTHSDESFHTRGDLLFSSLDTKSQQQILTDFQSQQTVDGYTTFQYPKGYTSKHQSPLQPFFLHVRAESPTLASITKLQLPVFTKCFSRLFAQILLNTDLRHIEHVRFAYNEEGVQYFLDVDSFFTQLYTLKETGVLSEALLPFFECIPDVEHLEIVPESIANLPAEEILISRYLDRFNHPYFKDRRVLHINSLNLPDVKSLKISGAYLKMYIDSPNLQHIEIDQTLNLTDLSVESPQGVNFLLKNAPKLHSLSVCDFSSIQINNPRNLCSINIPQTSRLHNLNFLNPLFGGFSSVPVSLNSNQEVVQFLETMNTQRVTWRGSGTQYNMFLIDSIEHSDLYRFKDQIHNLDTIKDLAFISSLEGWNVELSIRSFSYDLFLKTIKHHLQTGELLDIWADLPSRWPIFYGQEDQEEYFGVGFLSDNGSGTGGVADTYEMLLEGWQYDHNFIPEKHDPNYKLRIALDTMFRWVVNYHLLLACLSEDDFEEILTLL